MGNKINGYFLNAFLFMRWLLFLSRLAFVCNVFFLLALSLQFGKWFHNQDAEATVLIIGYFMAALLNPAAVVCYLLFLLLKRSRLRAVPGWLMIANALFLVFQIFYLLHLNGR